MLRANARLPQKDGWAAFGYQIWIMALLLVVVLLYWLFDFSLFPWVYPACVSLGTLFLWSMWAWKKSTNDLFNPYIFFFVAAVIFNGGHALLEIFDMNERGILGNEFEAETLAQTLFLVIISLVALHLGALLSVANIDQKRQAVSQQTRQIDTMAVQYVGWALIAVAILPAIYTLAQATRIVLASGYGGLYAAEAATGIGSAPQILMRFIVPGCLFLLAGNAGKRLPVVVSLVVVSLYTLTQFMLGIRGWAILPVLLYVWVWQRTVSPVPKTLLFGGGAFAMFVVFPLIGAIRNMGVDERTSIDTIIETFVGLGNPAVAILSEMGASMKTVAHTIELVPATRAFDEGATYFYASTSLLPNLFWDIHPAVVYGRPSDWLIWEVDPYIASRGGGLGFSFIAEAYLNFGWIGTPLFMLVCGFLFGKIVLLGITSRDSAHIALVATFFAFASFWVRQEFMVVMRPLVWYALVPYLGVLYLRYGVRGWLYGSRMQHKHKPTVAAATASGRLLADR
jgi:oligosaccharide repeat unit polymerase